MKKYAISFVSICTLLSVAGCTTPIYSKRNTTSETVGDDAMRYGSVAAAAGAGYYAGNKITGSKESGAVAGAAAGLLMLGVHKLNDQGKMKAYNEGILDGACSVRSEILTEKWRREAILGITDDDQGTVGVPRRVFVPARQVNGITYPAGYQEVSVIQ